MNGSYCIRLLAAAVSSLVLCTAAVLADSPPQVSIGPGTVQGLQAGGASEFLGIPYATPPVGNLRWRPPVAAPAWSGVLQATKYGPSCAQVTTLGVFAGPPNDNEDCLTLNVFTPALGASHKMPVLIWLHGGGNMAGSSTGYDGTRLASLGKTVVVTLNYRLGMLGWLANPALDAEGHPFGNYGLLDQQLALKWVRANIAAFGGDPSNVTLSGQSAGANDTEANMVSPLATGLFQRAIFESSVVDGIPLKKALKRGDDFANAEGCGRGAAPAVAACLRALPIDKIMQVSGTASELGPYISGFIVDGQIVPASGAFTALKTGKFQHMPVMSGTTHDERNFAIAGVEYFSGPPPHAVTAKQVQGFVTKVYPPDLASKILATYDFAGYATPQLAWDAIGSDGMVCPQFMLSRLLAPQVPVYHYEFADETAPFYFPDMPGFWPGAAHTSDMQYLFPLWHGTGVSHPLNAAQQGLSDAMILAWTNFARNGDPNGPGAPSWPALKVGSGAPGAVLSETLPKSVALTASEFSAMHHCDFWDSAQKFGVIYDLPH